MKAEDRAVYTPGLVLVVDDVEDNRILARAYLERIGWRVDECDGAIKAMEYLSHKMPQAMLVDIRMPGVSGDQLATYVRSLGTRHNIRLVGYTAHSSNVDAARFKAAGFDEVLIKPVLLAAMSKALPDPRAAS